ncbi:Origin recognition complex, subunit 6 [Kalmanozyma brasiliensis GHG001]|uniref:Origin recognition complex, subunit 6 n=1 Tax=Kalmanozyma brasiliensis (strain GHG001) TaxID=1365824 RepID=UPI00286811BE|nr:Origin recognition complex, subunit 6 [Kalmanozyma brasiliensis GHG001]KAF6766919.1 Origin recognition complex, subunit 6 [Kalmanozyma brasiliensis GHG001]
MAASRRAQIQSLCGVRTGPLIDRVESYLAAVDIWSRRGNQKAVKNAGTGVVAICCYLAAESLDAQVPDRGSAIRASGLPPAQFATAEKEFRTAVQSASSASSQALSGPSDNMNSAFGASLTATPTKRPIRSSPLKTPVTASRSKEALLAKAQAIQAGGLFDQTMRATPVANPASASKNRVTASGAGIDPQSGASTAANAPRDREDAAANGDISTEGQPMRKKPRRMGKVVFGLAIHSSLNRLDEQEEANDERRRRNRIVHIQSAIDKLRSSNPTWRYLDAPRDFLVTISPSERNVNP